MADRTPDPLPPVPPPMTHFRWKSLPLRSAAVLVFFLSAVSLSVAAEEVPSPLSQSIPTAPPGFGESIGVVFLNAGTLELEFSAALKPLKGKTTAYSLTGTPLGDGLLIRNGKDAGKWDLIFGSGATFSIAWQPQMGMYTSGDFASQAVLVYDDGFGEIDQVPGMIGWIRVGPIPYEGKNVGIFGWWWSPLFWMTIDWYQFFTLKITWEGTLPDGTPTSGVAPGTAVTGSNGGAPVKADGSTTYVDSVVPSDPSYLAGAAPGDLPDMGPGGSLMMDFPGVDLPNELADMVGLPAKDIELTKLIYHADFTLYMLINGSVAYRCDWSITEEFAMPSAATPANPDESDGDVGGPDPASPGFPMGTPTAGPATSFDDRHAEALAYYVLGLPIGALVK